MTSGHQHQDRLWRAIRADMPVSRLLWWSVPSTMGIEPYMDVKLEPGEEKRWSHTIDYYGPGDRQVRCPSWRSGRAADRRRVAQPEQPLPRTSTPVSEVLAASSQITISNGLSWLVSPRRTRKTAFIAAPVSIRQASSRA